MKVLITGANGMLARTAAAHCRESGDDVTAVAHAEMDIADADAVAKVFADVRPDAVLNCAAYTNVDGAETNADTSYAANCEGVGNLASAAKEIDAAFVTVSTDFVFDGTCEGFNTQRETPNPLGVYGQSKLAGERLAAEKYARSVIVRSGWIFGEGGTNFLSVMPGLLAKGGPMTAISDAFGTPTYAVDLAARMRELVLLDVPGIFHVTNAGDGTTYYGFAHELCDLMGIDRANVSPISQGDLNRPAARPLNSKLACLYSEPFGLAPLRPWQEALRDFVK